MNIKSNVEIQFMRDAGRVVEEALAIFKEVMKPRITTAELDKLAEGFIIKHGFKPYFRVIMDFQHPYVHLLMMKWFMEFHISGFYLNET